ncbi:MAG: hypothetical protein ACT4OS_01855 [Acidimicrobiales bacterium]
MIDFDAGALWLYVPAVLIVYGLVLGILWSSGDDRTPSLAGAARGISEGSERCTGLAGWAGAGALTALWAGAVAAIGLYWDVAWHIDNGRDESVLTPSHTLILIGLGGLILAALVAVILATVTDAPTAFKWSGLSVPWSGLVLAGLGLGATAAFPLDALWHSAYGIDVTLWSPTHLQLVAGGGLGPVAAWLMLREGRVDGDPTPFGRGLEVAILGAALVGLSAFQGEFDFGVPQFQAAYLPVLIAVASGLVLVLARIAYGPGGALWAVGVFVLMRTCLTILVSGALAHTTPRFPLYLAAGICVEIAALWLGTERGLRFALVAGALVGTIGVAGELAWISLSGWASVGVPPVASIVALGVLTTLAAMAAAAMGLGLGQAAAPRTGFSAVAGLLGGLVLIVALAVPLPRNVGSVEALIRLTPAGDKADVEVILTPADAAVGATAFGVTAWQGGGPRQTAGLTLVAPGRYRSDRALPVGGAWKTLVGLQRGDEVMAAAIYLPADPAIGAPEVPALAERQTRFVRNTDILLRESRPGPAWVAGVAYAGVALVVSAWIGLMAGAVRRIGSASDELSLQGPEGKQLHKFPVGRGGSALS